MADKDDIVEEIQDSFLSCPICYQPFNRPKALPCLHTFCEGCLRDYVTSRHGSNSDFPCPLCRQDIVVPLGGVSALPDNHFIVGLQHTVNPYGLQYNASAAKETTPLISTSHAAQVERNTSNRLIRRFGNFGTLPHEFQKPSGISCSYFTDEVFILDSAVNKISVFSTAGEFRRYFTCDCFVRDIALKRGGTLLVTVCGDGSSVVREYTLEGAFLGSYGAYYKYEKPFGVTLTSNDRPVITGLRQHCVHILTQQYKRSQQFGSYGKGVNNFNIPYYVTTNSRDEIIIADCGNHRIKIHKADGTFIRQFGSEGKNPGEFMYPMGVCVDEYDNIYVADANNYRVQMFTCTGQYAGTPVKDTYENGTDVKPINVTFSQRNVLMVVLRGSMFAQMHSYFWESSRYSVTDQKKSLFQKLCCCV